MSPLLRLSSTVLPPGITGVQSAQDSSLSPRRSGSGVQGAEGAHRSFQSPRQLQQARLLSILPKDFQQNTHTRGDIKLGDLGT